MEDQRPLGEAFKDIRNSYGFRQVTVAKRAKIDRSRLSNFESCRIELSDAEMRRLMAAIDQLIEESSEAGVLPIKREEEWVKIASFFKDQLKKWDVSQVELAKALGLDTATVSLVLNGYRELSVDDQDRWFEIADSLYKQKQAAREQARSQVTNYYRLYKLAHLGQPIENVAEENVRLKARIAELEAEVAKLKAEIEEDNHGKN